MSLWSPVLCDHVAVLRYSHVLRALTDSDEQGKSLGVTTTVFLARTNPKTGKSLADMKAEGSLEAFIHESHVAQGKVSRLSQTSSSST